MDKVIFDSFAPLKGMSAAVWTKRLASGSLSAFTGQWGSFAIGWNAEGKPKCSLRTADNGFFYVTGQAVMPLGAWTHLACTYNPSTKAHTLYVNGNKAAEEFQTITSLYADSLSTIGRADTINFSVAVDEMAFWDRALLPSEVHNLANATAEIAITPPSYFVSERIPAGKFSDVKVSFLASTANVQFEVSVDSGITWTTLNSGERLSERNGPYSLPAYGLYYRVTFAGPGTIYDVELKFIPAPDATNVSAKLGMNLTAVTYYSTGKTFVDLMKGFPPLDPVTKTAILNNVAKDFPSGEYTLIVGGGAGNVRIAQRTFRTPGTFKVPFDGTTGLDIRIL